MTNLEPGRAGPALLAELVRGQWGIESLHWLRDTVYREDHCTARTGSGPRVMAALRNLAIGAIHLLGRRDITETTRWATRVMGTTIHDSAHHNMINYLGTPVARRRCTRPRNRAPDPTLLAALATTIMAVIVDLCGRGLACAS